MEEYIDNNLLPKEGEACRLQHFKYNIDIGNQKRLGSYIKPLDLEEPCIIARPITII